LYRGWVLNRIFHQPFICFSSSMIRRAVLDEVGWFDESLPLAIDYDLWLRIASKYRIDHVDERLVLYRTGHANLSRRLVERNQCVRRIIRGFLDDREAATRLNLSLRRLVWAEHCCDTASAYGRKRFFKAVGWYLRSLANRPLHGPAWRSLAVFWWPERWRSAILRLIGRPDWRKRQATLADQP
jgi:hypothetical protein